MTAQIFHIFAMSKGKTLLEDNEEKICKTDAV